MVVGERVVVGAVVGAGAVTEAVVVVVGGAVVAVAVVVAAAVVVGVVSAAPRETATDAETPAANRTTANPTRPLTPALSSRSAADHPNEARRAAVACAMKGRSVTRPKEAS